MVEFFLVISVLFVVITFMWQFDMEMVQSVIDTYPDNPPEWQKWDDYAVFGWGHVSGNHWWFR